MTPLFVNSRMQLVIPELLKSLWFLQGTAGLGNENVVFDFGDVDVEFILVNFNLKSLLSRG